MKALSLLVSALLIATVTMSAKSLTLATQPGEDLFGIIGLSLVAGLLIFGIAKIVRKEERVPSKVATSCFTNVD